MKTPKNLNDLQYQEWVIDVLKTQTPQAAAEQVLNELFPTDDTPVKCNFLFQEENEDGENVKVYEAYKDSGSVDYLYLRKTY